MTGRKSLAALCMLCALGFSAIAVQSAAGASKGTTAFTCVSVTPAKETAGFSKSHCKAEDAVSTNANYEHVAVAANTATEIKGTNSTTMTLKTIQAGVTVELQASGLSGEGWMENALDAGTGEHYVRDEGKTVFTGVTVTQPAGKGCRVFTDNEGSEGAEGALDTNTLAVTSTGQGDRLKFSPAAGEVFATFIMAGCSNGSLNGTWQITGSLTGVPDGATVNFSHTEGTSEGTLKARGQKAALGGTVAISSKDPLDETFHPLSVTTVETP